MTAYSRNLFGDTVVRVRFVLAAMLFAFTVLVVSLWRIQAGHIRDYEKDLVRQSVRRVRLPGGRGRIIDRAGMCLADNRPSFCIAVFIEELRQPGGRPKTTEHVAKIIQRLGTVLEIEPAVTRSDIRTHMLMRLPLPLLAWKDVSAEVLARFAERAGDMPGVDIYVEALRTYPSGPVAAHVLGHVGRADFEQDSEDPYHYNLPEMAGRAGVERRFDGVLRGEAGGRLVRVDVSGFRHEDSFQRDPRPGDDVQLALDLRVQRVAEETLGDTPGAVVVLDPRNGDVLALASRPGFDPNAFVPAISTEAWAALRDNKQRPLVNRTVADHYAPGSIFKPLVAFAALENKLARSGTTFNCPGHLDLGRARFHCWTQGQHGDLSMRAALQRSCNVYFYNLGLQIGHEYIYHTALALGLGQKTGVSLPGEVPGIVPNDAWMRERFGHGWRAGDTCNFSIGQGAVVVTPLQMATVCATIANGGHVYQPRLVLGIREAGNDQYRGIPPRVQNEMNWSPSSLKIVRGGMRDVVMSERGTGKLARVPGVSMAGKTGTAEYGKKEDGKKRAWMIAYAPYENPRYAVALVLDDAISGGVSAAPRVKQLMSGLLGGKDPGEGQG